MDAFEPALRSTLEDGFSLPADAVDWLMDIWRSIQTLDDLVDGDATVERHGLDRLIWDLLAGHMMNPFFQRFQSQLVPVLALAILQWKAADDAERAGKADARSYMWRAGYYQLVMMAVMLSHGPSAAMQAASAVMHLYGESFESYMGEFNA